VIGEVERFHAGRWSIIPSRRGDVVIGSRAALTRTVVRSLGAGLLGGYVALAVALGAWLPMLVAPPVLGLLGYLVVTVRTSRDRARLARYRPRTRPYREDEITGQAEDYGEPAPSAPSVPPSPTYGASWRTQRAIGSGRYLPRGSA
jgi:hypothetical protein